MLTESLMGERVDGATITITRGAVSFKEAEDI
jgi:hypothetical protein